MNHQASIFVTRSSCVPELISVTEDVQILVYFIPDARKRCRTYEKSRQDPIMSKDALKLVRDRCRACNLSIYKSAVPSCLPLVPHGLRHRPRLFTWFIWLAKGQTLSVKSRTPIQVFQFLPRSSPDPRPGLAARESPSWWTLSFGSRILCYHLLTARIVTARHMFISLSFFGRIIRLLLPFLSAILLSSSPHHNAAYLREYDGSSSKPEVPHYIYRTQGKLRLQWSTSRQSFFAIGNIVSLWKYLVPFTKPLLIMGRSTCARVRDCAAYSRGRCCARLNCCLSGCRVTAKSWKKSWNRGYTYPCRSAIFSSSAHQIRLWRSDITYNWALFMIQAAIAAAPHNSVRHHWARASLDHSWIQPQPIFSIVDFDTVSMLGNVLLGFHCLLIDMLAQGR